jgi:hypothetical protein
MTFEIVMLVLAVGFGAFGFYMQKGSPRTRTSPQQLARYRRGTFVLTAWAIIVLVRLLTHTYK